MRTTIRGRLLLILVTISIVTAGVTAWLGYRTARQALEHQSFEQLTAVREMKANQVEDYFAAITGQIVTLSESPAIVAAVRELAAAFRAAEGEADGQRDVELRLFYQSEFLPRLDANRTQPSSLEDYWPGAPLARRFQHAYLKSNPFPTGSKHQLDAADDDSPYDTAHRRHHPTLRRFLERFGYYDVFLIEPSEGRIIYSVMKEVDFATSLTTGPYAETNLAEAYRAARSAGRGEFVRLVDFAAYAPSYDAEASFVASPIYDGVELVGVLAFQMPVDRLNEIMTSRRQWSSVGLGTSGETYLVGDDFTMRSQSRFLLEDRDGYLRALAAAGESSAVIAAITSQESTIGLQTVRTPGTRAALDGETGARTFADYRGVPVLSAYRPLAIPDLSWVLMSEIDRDEAFAPVRRLRDRTLLWMAVLTAAVVGIAFLFARSLTRPVGELARRAAALADGDVDTPIESTGDDEIADLSRSFEAMRRSVRAHLEEQERAIDALSLPLIPLHDDVLAMPLVGGLDAARLLRVRETLIDGLHARGARAAILDLTGVGDREVDAAAAERLVATAHTATLLGVHVVITGIQPELARALADLDLDTKGIATERTLRGGLDWALRRLDQREESTP